MKKDGSDKGGLSPANAPSYVSSTHISLKIDEKTGLHGELTGGSESGKTSWETKSVNSRGRLETRISSGSDRVAGVATYSGPSLSPSSSLGSLSSEKSTLNPNAKVCKLKIDFIEYEIILTIAGIFYYFCGLSQSFPLFLVSLCCCQEFKLNPNAKSFVPSQTSVRPRSPVSDSSFYFPANVSAVPSMPTMPMGVGVSIS